MSKATAPDQAELDEQRLGMREYKFTFGWDQPHGPNPDDSRGHFATVWAPTANLAADMAYARYEGKWSHQYSPKFWAQRSILLHGCVELEVLQYHPDRVMPVYPKRDPQYPTCIYGSEFRKR